MNIYKSGISFKDIFIHRSINIVYSCDFIPFSRVFSWKITGSAHFSRGKQRQAPFLPLTCAEQGQRHMAVPRFFGDGFKGYLYPLVMSKKLWKIAMYSGVSHETWWFSRVKLCLYTNLTVWELEHGHRSSGFSHERWWILHHSSVNV